MRLITILIALFVSIQVQSQYIDFPTRPKTFDDSTLNVYLNRLTTRSSLSDWLCEIIAEMYQIRREYGKAIAYYDSSQTKYKSGFPLCGNDYYYRLAIRLEQISYCFSQLGQTDSIIARLTPYVFDPAFRSMNHDSRLSSRYEDLLLKKYSKDEIIHQINNAFNSLIVNATIENSFNSKYFVTVKSSMTLFNMQVEIANYSTIVNDKSQIPTKEYVINQLKQSLIYKTLTGKE